MPRITVSYGSRVKECHSSMGRNLLEVLRENGIPICAPCAGKGICGKCRIHAPALQPTDLDRRFLAQSQLAQGLRLACDKVVVCDGTVSLPEITEIAGIETVAGASAAAGTGRPENGPGFAVALDIGTTTIAAYLLSLPDGVIFGQLAQGNAQLSFGADVITRLQYILENKRGQEELHHCLILQINEMLSALMKEAAVEKETVNIVTAAGNTVMLHLLLNENPCGMAQAPFRPAFLQAREAACKALGITAAPCAKLWTLPCISAFVGGDIAGGVFSCGVFGSAKNWLLIDIGTNGEMAGFGPNGGFCCSAAAGPAFEGGNLHCGMASLPGAISRVFLQDGAIAIETIGGGEATGLCGSGLIDAVSVMLAQGLIEESGFMETQRPEIYRKDGVCGFWLTPKVVITQKDIREFQLAKSAIRTGIELLLETMQVSAGEIDAVFLAGGFGSRMDKDSCIAVGLLPASFSDKIVQIGNASGKGAIMAAIDADKRALVQEIAGSFQDIGLSAHAGFADKFLEHMTLERG